MKTIQLGQGCQARVDNKDYKRVKIYRWYATYNPRTRSWYAMTWGQKKDRLYMHRLILNAPKTQQVDHRDHDTLNNCRENLRLATNSQNHMNGRKPRSGKTPYKGVYRVPNSQAHPWQARITLNYKRINLGCWRTAKEAALAYNKAAEIFFREFALPNQV